MRVIVLTGHKPQPGELPGIAGVVSKPVGLGELARRVRKALDG